jgi:hypothetical protein
MTARQCRLYRMPVSDRLFERSWRSPWKFKERETNRL